MGVRQSLVGVGEWAGRLVVAAEGAAVLSR